MRKEIEDALKSIYKPCIGELLNLFQLKDLKCSHRESLKGKVLANLMLIETLQICCIPKCHWRDFKVVLTKLPLESPNMN